MPNSFRNERKKLLVPLLWYYDGHENKLILPPSHSSAVASYYLQMIWWIVIRVYGVPPYLNQFKFFVKLYIQSQGPACAYQVALLIPMWHLYELGMNRMKYFSQKKMEQRRVHHAVQISCLYDILKDVCCRFKDNVDPHFCKS